MRKVYFAFLLVFSFFFSGRLNAQTATYNFTVLSGTFTSIASTGTLSTISGALDANQSGINLGFTFNYCGSPYTSLSACTHAWVSLTNSTSFTWVNAATNIIGAGWLMPFWDDVSGTGHSAYYQTTGLPGSRVFTFEWTNWGNNIGTGTANIQIKLYEGTNIIEYWYGTGSYSGNSATIGISNSTTDYKTVDPGFATATAGTFTTSLGNTPTAGTIYRWSQCPIPATATNDGPTCTGGTINLTGTTTATTYYWTGPGGYYSTSLTPSLTGMTAAMTGNYVFNATDGTCTTTATTNVSLTSPAPSPTVTPTTATICNGGSVMLTATVPPTPPTILSQNFNSGIGTWTVDNTGMTSASALSGFHTEPDGYTYVPYGMVYHSPDNSTFLYSNADAGGSGSITHTKIVSPSFSLYGYTSATLTFQHFYQKWLAGDVSTNVDISIDGGLSWTTLNNYVPAGTVGTSTSFASASFNLAAYLGNANCKLRFEYFNTWGFWWAIDNVLISGVAPPLTVTWSPTTDLFTDAALTTAYTGTPLNIVYYHPTTISTTTVVTYTATSGTGTCASTATAVVTVNPGVTPITTSLSTVCIGGTTTLSDATPGGVWSSASPGIATVNTSGVVTGVATGTANILYTVAGCSASIIITVNSAPSPITGTAITCVGSSTTLSDASPGGAWSSGSPGIASVGATTGIVGGVTPGTAVISYQIGSACLATRIVTITAFPSMISGVFTTCVSLTTTLSNAVSGGTWTSSTPSVAVVGIASGVVTGMSPGTATITYSIGAGCSVYQVVTVGTISAITGTPSVCVGSNTTLSHGTSGGAWTSSATAIATVNATSGVVTGISGGTAIITYTLPTSCYTTMIVTVNPLPSVITGTASVCQYLTTTLSDATAGGTWSSSTPAVATVDPATGVVTGVTGGTSTITYTIATGCYVTQVVTVNTVSGITGTAFICVGLTATLSNATSGGTWTSSNTAVATVGAGTGIVSGVAPGTSTITYTITSTGCFTTAIATVNASPAAITGTFYVCTGFNTSLADATIGGTWISGTPAVGTVSTSGVVTGVTAGTTVITYSLGAGCQSVATITVNPSPAAIVGTNVICGGTSTTLTDATSGGTWTSSIGATVGATTGIVVGGAGGTPTITYTIPPVGSMAACYALFPMTVNPLPAAITGTTTVCAGTAVTWSDATVGGTWTSSNTAIAVVDPSTGVVTGLVAGTSSIVYTLSTGCFRARTVTVNASPGAISGTLSMCVGVCQTLSATPTPGTWSSSTPGIATVTSPGGVVCGAFPGNAVITYTATSSGCYTVAIVTVVSTPPAITGTPIVCPGTTTTLSNSMTGGAWSSSNTGIATIDAGGVVTGVALGTTTITYLTSGCMATVVVTVTSLPAAITGSSNACVGSTTTYTDASGAGTWTSSNTAVGTIGTSSGILTGITSGTTTITYYSGTTGCWVSKVITVNPAPSSISGPLSVCIGYTTTLSSTPTGGNWTVGAPASGTGTIGASSGVLTGGTAGTVTVTYAAPTTGCTVTTVATVNALPPAITGNAPVCVGNSITLVNTAPGGTWGSSNTSIAAVDAGGVVTGVGGGTATITYTIGSGCMVMAVVTVNPLPTAISGLTLICAGSTSTLSSTPGGGAWTSSTPSVATVGASSGIVTGAGVSSPGTSTITYTISTGCRTTTVVTVNPVPSNITFSTLAVCPGNTITLADATSGGVWGSSNAAIADIGTSTGIVTGVAAGTATMSYTVSSTGCYKTAVVTVNPLPAAIGGTAVVCVLSATLLTDGTPGGTWISGSTAIATIGSSSGIATGASAGTTLITYRLTATGCQVTTPLTVNPLPSILTGVMTACPGTSTTLSDSVSGGTWSSSNTGVATVAAFGPSQGVVTGVTAGTTRITYTLPTGCFRTTLVTINPLPLPIGGFSSTICPGTSTTLADGSGGGAWSVGSPASGSATITSTGVITGFTAGTVTVSYTLPTGCLVTAEVTVNPLPASISGGSAVCLGLTTTLTNSTSGGTWISSNSAVASVGSSDGIVLGNSVGVVNITYKLTGTGCYTTQSVTVNGLPPAINGTAVICPGTCTTLTNAAGGGTWGSTDPDITVGTSTGSVCGVSAGTAVVTYTIGSGCIATKVVTVNATPPAITGSLGVCIGFYTTLSNAITGGTWVSSNTSVAPIDAAGVVFGNTVGTSNITYTAPSGCTITAVVTVNPPPSAITGSVAFCNLTTTTLHDATGGGTWSVANPSILTIDPVTGEATGVNPGSTTVTYTLPTGCYVTRTETIILAPYPITGPTTVCEGYSVSLGNVIAGGTWISSAPGTASMPDVDSSIVNGVSAGLATITYTLSNGCYSTYDMTVNVTPASITGIKQVCYGLQTTLFDATSGGTWSSLDPLTAAIGSSSGVVDGTGPGTTTISYIMPTGCYNTTTVTVNPLPTPIEGSFEICYLSTTILTDSTSGGTWTSSNVGVIMPNPSTGLMAAVGIGTSNITYTLASGCIVTQQMTVDPLPAPITGIFDVCQGLSVTLDDATGTGTWSSSNSSVAPITSGGVVTGGDAGVATITYQLITGCYVTQEVTVNALPPAITGSLMMCAGFATNLTNATPGGVWTTDASSAGIGYLNSITGVVSGIAPGTMNITYTLPSGCLTTAVATINALPEPITGSFKVCVGSTTTLDDPDMGGTWSSSNPAVGSVDFINGVVTGVAAGTTNITYKLLATGCINKAVVTVNPLPSVITGPSQVCENATITLTSATPVSGHGWESMTPSIATVGMTTGIVTGVSAGTVVINFTNTTTLCSVSKVITVNAVPAAIAGPNGVCLSSTVTLTDATTGGTWSSSNPAAAPISSAGVVSGVALGNTIITYKLTSTGCQALKPMTVNALPNLYNVVGGGNYCEGGNGVPISLDGSQVGIGYALYYGSSATGYLTGTGAPLNFGLLTMAGSYHVVATNGITGCSRDMIGSVSVVINPSVVPTIDIHSPSGTDTVCPGGTLLFTVDTTYAGTTPTFLWKVNGIAVSTSPTYTYTPASGDVISVKMTSNANCAVPVTANDTMHVTVLPSAMPVANVLITPGDTVCRFNPTTYNAAATYGGSAPLFTWYVNGSVAGTGPSYTYVPDSLDQVQLMMISNYQCATDDTVYSSLINMVVEPLRIPHVDIVAYPGLYIADGQADSLVAYATNAGSHPTYQWKVNSIPVPGATNPVYVAVFHDYDSVNCEVTSSDVCHGIASFDWVFINLHPVSVGNVTTAAADLKLLPNPNKGEFTIRGDLGRNVDEEVTLEVTDMLGQVVYSGVARSHKGRVEEQVSLSSTLANGMYLLNLRTTTAHQTFHFVIEK